MTAESITLISVLTGLVAYAGLTLFFVFGLIRQITGRAALIASTITAAWYLALYLTGLSGLAHILEMSAYVTWTLVLARVLGVGVPRFRDPDYRRQTRLAALAVAVYVVGVVIVIGNGANAVLAVATTQLPLAKLLLCLFGLVFVEQVARNTRRDYIWRLKFMTLGLATMFGYGFALHADTVLFSELRFALFAPQGFINALAVPLIIVASKRNAVHQLNFNLSRQFVFRSGVLIIAGVYLSVMGVAGYYVRLVGGQWGAVFSVLMVAIGLLGLLVVALSTQVRSALRVALKRNLYEYKYDYREEWLRVSNELTESDSEDSLEERTIHAVGELVQSGSGAVYRLTDQHTFVSTGVVNVESTAPLSSSSAESLTRFFAVREWIIDMDAYRRDPESYPELDLHIDLPALDWARFIVPLPIGNQLFGILILGHTSIPMTLDWEDYDTLKVVARQAAGVLALKRADEVLSASEQFRVREELSAFVVHDLKTISGQLSLMGRNAERHRDNPAFIDDLLRTVENAVRRMNHLLSQLRNPKRDPHTQRIDVLEVLDSVIDERSDQRPRPTLTTEAGTHFIDGHREQLRSAFNHLIQNAQEATSDDGEVSVIATTDSHWIHIEITDTGQGMTEAFLREHLFSPFKSSKGVAGIGIGAYQARELIRNQSGDVSVTSRLDKGTSFMIRLPRAQAQADLRSSESVASQS